jgi:hypothetical protein
MRNIWDRAGREAIAVAMIAIFFLPLCGFLFGCGCRNLWAGGVEHCNIHVPGPPDCPWCSGPFAIQWIPFILVCLSAIGGIRWMRRFRTRVFLRDLIAGLLAGFVTASVLAWIYRIFDLP